VDGPQLEGSRLDGRYVLESQVASGGMATVWRGTDQVLGRPVAVKVLHENLSQDEELLERFRMEAVAAARLSHPSVVRVFDTGVDGGVCYIVMELFEGTTLADLVAQDGPLPPDEAARIVRAALHGLAHAHREGIVHRDVKPSNILVDASGLVKVTDFGIAKAAFAEGDLTTTGSLLGTAKYLAPEQVEGGAVDPRTDIYAAGIVLYEALTGRPPFEADTHMATATMRLAQEPPAPGSLRSGIPRPLEAAVLKALARSPEDRFQSAEEMEAALDRSTPDGTERVRRAQAAPLRAGPRPSMFRSWMLVPLVLLVAAAAAVGAFFLVDSLVDGGLGNGGTGEEAPRLQAVANVTASDYDPAPGDGEEHEETLGGATDGDPGTAWITEEYSNAAFGNAKPGVGIVFDLGEPTEVERIRLRTTLPGWVFEIKGSNDGAAFTDPLASADRDTAFTVESSVVVIDIEPATYRYFLVWITLLPESPEHRASVAEADFLTPRG
jgi:hypothetical protein